MIVERGTDKCAFSTRSILLHVVPRDGPYAHTPKSDVTTAFYFLALMCYQFSFQIHKKKHSLENCVTEYCWLSAVQVVNDQWMSFPQGLPWLCVFTRKLALLIWPDLTRLELIPVIVHTCCHQHFQCKLLCSQNAEQYWTAHLKALGFARLV